QDRSCIRWETDAQIARLLLPRHRALQFASQVPTCSIERNADLDSCCWLAIQATVFQKPLVIVCLADSSFPGCPPYVKFAGDAPPVPCGRPPSLRRKRRWLRNIVDACIDRHPDFSS